MILLNDLTGNLQALDKAPLCDHLCSCQDEYFNLQYEIKIVCYIYSIDLRRDIKRRSMRTSCACDGGLKGYQETQHSLYHYASGQKQPPTEILASLFRLLDHRRLEVLDLIGEF